MAFGRPNAVGGDRTLKRSTTCTRNLEDLLVHFYFSLVVEARFVL